MTNPTVPIEYRSPKHGYVRIGRHVIVGATSVVFPGVNIDDGCSIGAFSMVNKSTEPWGIYAGVPAARVRERSKDLLLLEQEYLASES
jgi:acetyltransferase-like isoleucine patch superfamily enzyme